MPSKDISRIVYKTVESSQSYDYSYIQVCISISSDGATLILNCNYSHIAYVDRKALLNIFISN